MEIRKLEWSGFGTGCPGMLVESPSPGVLEKPVEAAPCLMSVGGIRSVAGLDELRGLFQLKQLYVMTLPHPSPTQKPLSTQWHEAHFHMGAGRGGWARTEATATGKEDTAACRSLPALLLPRGSQCLAVRAEMHQDPVKTK